MVWERKLHMIDLTQVLYILRTLAEGIIAVLSVHMLSGKKTDWKKHILTGIMLGIIVYLIRQLPIHYGVHTIIILLIMIFIFIQLSKIPFYKAVASSIVFTMILYVSEIVTFLMYSILGYNVNDISPDTINGILFSIPPIMIALVVSLFLSKLKFWKVNK